MAQVKQEQTPWEDSANLNQNQNLDQNPDCKGFQSSLLPLVKTEPEEVHIPDFQELSAFQEPIKHENESSDCDTDDTEDWAFNSSAENTQQCSECGETFGSILSLRRHHLKVHKDKLPFHCPFCQRGFASNSHLTDHLRIHTGEKPYSCPVCAKTFSQRGNIHRHVRYTECAEEFSKKTLRTQHWHLHNGEEPDNCTFCRRVNCSEYGEGFTSLSKLKMHERTHRMNNRELTFRCSICKREFGRKCHLNQHARTHVEEWPFRCSFCWKGFSRLGNLERHEMSHVEEKPIQCTFCPKVFAKNRLLTRHLRTHTEEKSHKCTLCLESFTSKTLLKQHKKTHGKKHQCSKCEKVFTSRLRLLRHEKNHITCPLCPKTYQTKLGLKMHMGTHTELPFGCSVCKTRFNQQEDLQKHMDSHKKSYLSCQEKLDFETLKCQFCSEEFPKPIFLKRHMQIHITAKTLEEKQKRIKKTRPLKCTICSLEFEDRTELMSHVGTHSWGKLIGCWVCGKGFTLLKNMLQHVKEKHQSAIRDEKLESGRSQSETVPSEPPGRSVDSATNESSKNIHRLRMTSSVSIGKKENQRQTVRVEERLNLSPARSVDFPTNSSLKSNMQTMDTSSVSDFLSFLQRQTIHVGEILLLSPGCSLDFPVNNFSKSHLKTVVAAPVSGDELKSEGTFLERSMDVKNDGKTAEESVNLKTPSPQRDQTHGPYSCTICSKVFNFSSELYKHLRAHTGEKPFSCSVCAKGFTQRSMMQRHLQTHLS
ncbi:unnamed protein product [Knipowitschia caucasica]